MSDTTSLELLISLLEGIAAGTGIGLGALGFIRGIGKLCGHSEAACEEPNDLAGRPQPFARPTRRKARSPWRTVTFRDHGWPPPLDARA